MFMDPCSSVHHGTSEIFSAADHPMQEGATQAAAAAAGEKAAHEMAQRTQRAFHDDCRDRAAGARKKAADLDDRVVQIHTATQQRHRELKEKDARGVRTAAQKVADRKQAARAAEASDMARGIQSFEGKLAKMGKGAAASRAAEVGLEGTAEALGTTPLSQGQRLKQFLPEKDRIQREAEVRTSWLDMCTVMSIAKCSPRDLLRLKAL